MLSNALDSYEAVINADPHSIEVIHQRCTRLYTDARYQSLKALSRLLGSRRINPRARVQDIEARISRVYVGLNPIPQLSLYDPRSKVPDLSESVQRARVIATHIGIPHLRSEQEAVIHASLAGKSVLVDFPTGYGKSACFTLPAVLQDSVTVVIVPFVSIIESHLHIFASLHTKMPDLSAILGSRAPVSIYNLVGCFIGKENRNRYLKKELHAFAMDYRAILGLSNEQSICYEDPSAVDTFTKRLVYTTPESFLLVYDTVWQPLAQSRKLKRIVVDECHILISWAFLFKKDYIIVCKRISWLQRLFSINLSLFSGSLTETKQKLLLSWVWNGDDLYYFTVNHIIPPNVRFMITKCADQNEVLQKSLDQVQHCLSKYETAQKGPSNSGCKGIVFCLTKVECLAMCKTLKSRGVHALPFHSNTTTTLSTITKADIVVSTSSLSHGVDLQDVDFVIVCGCCLSITELIQYGGRCGRRGQSADYHFIYSNIDMLRSLHLKMVTQQHKSERVLGVSNPNSLLIYNRPVTCISFFGTDDFFHLGRFLDAVILLNTQEDIKNSLVEHMKQDRIDSGEDAPLRKKQIFIVIVLLIYYLTTAFNIYSNRILLRAQINAAKEPPLFCQPNTPEPIYPDSKLVRLIRLDFIIAILTGDGKHVKHILMQCFSNEYLSGKKFSLTVLANALLDQLNAYQNHSMHTEKHARNKVHNGISELKSVLAFTSLNHLPTFYQLISAKDNNLLTTAESSDMTACSQLTINEADIVVEILHKFAKQVLNACCGTDDREYTVTEAEVIDIVLYFLQRKALYIESAAEPCRHVHNVRISASTSNFCLILWTRTVELFAKYIDAFAQKPEG